MAKTFKTIVLCALALCLCAALSLGIGTIKVSANEAVKFDGAYVTLSDGIAAKFKFEVPDGYTKAKAVFILEGEQPTEKTLDVKTGTAIVAYDGLNPAQIDKTVSLALTLSGNEKPDIVGNATFKVSEYLDTLLTAAQSAFAEIKTQSQYVAMRTLAANLVNYSAKAKLYLNEADNVSSLLKTETVKNYVGTAVPTADDKEVGEIANGAEYGFIGAKLLLGEKVNVAFSFVAKEEGVKVEVTLGGNATTVEASEDTSITVNGGLKACSAVYRGLSVTELGETMTAKLVKDGAYIGNTVKYSVASYVYSMQTVGDEKMKALATAVYNYGLSAEKYISEMASIVEIAEKKEYVKEIEDFNTEKAYTKEDVAKFHHLKDGQLFVETVKKESAGKTTSGGKSVGAIAKGSQLSATLRLADKATVKITFVAATYINYKVKDNWKFSIDGIELDAIEDVNIRGGNPGNGEYWDWIPTSLGIYDLAAGDHPFRVEVTGGDCNVDCVKFEVISFGEYSSE